jgi:uncharacterized protein
MLQGEWGALRWEVSPGKVTAVHSLEVGCGARTKTDDEKDCTVFVGRSLETVRLSYRTSVMTGGSPGKELEAAQKLVKTSNPLYIGTEQIGVNNFMLKSVELSEATLNGSGAVVSGTLTLDFIENAAAISDTGIKLTYAGAEFARKVSIAECWIDQYAEDHADTLEIHFNDSEKKWDTWAKEGMAGKEITAEFDTIKTGKMFVHTVKPDGAVYVLKAMSIPPGAMNPTSKSWEKVTLEMIAKEIAGRHGLGFKSFDTKGITRAYVRQNNTPDFSFLSYRCRLEGAAFLVYDGSLILYDEAKRETAKPGKSVSLDGSKTVFSAEDNTARAFKKATVDNGEYVGTYTDAAMTGTAELRQHIDERLASAAEAGGIAQGFLRQKNKYRNIAVLERDILRAVAAGSTVTLTSAKVTSWGGAAYIYRIRHSLLKNRSKIWVRKPLAW